MILIYYFFTFFFFFFYFSYIVINYQFSLSVINLTIFSVKFWISISTFSILIMSVTLPPSHIDSVYYLSQGGWESKHQVGRSGGPRSGLSSVRGRKEPILKRPRRVTANNGSCRTFSRLHSATTKVTLLLFVARSVKCVSYISLTS